MKLISICLCIGLLVFQAVLHAKDRLKPVDKFHVVLHAEDSLKPVDKKANHDVRQILAWLHSLPKRQTNRILSGQYGWEDTRRIFEITGKWPALFEWYFWQKNNSSWEEWPLAEEHRERMKDYWNNGGLISIHMPIPNPKNKTHQRDRDMTDEEFRKIFEEGSRINKNFLQWLERLASNIDWLQKQGVTAFIRPFHEMNGGWFWYGQRDTEDFKKLFQYLVNYLIVKKELHNLIIVYSPNRGMGTLDYYPGDAFVDIVGIDSYQDPPVALKKEYASLIKLGKLFALTEVGWHVHAKTPEFSQDSKADIVDAMRKTTHDAIWWCSWARSNSPANQKNCKELYDDLLVITREEIDW